MTSNTEKPKLPKLPKGLVFRKMNGPYVRFYSNIYYEDMVPMVQEFVASLGHKLGSQINNEVVSWRSIYKSNYKAIGSMQYFPAGYSYIDILASEF